MNRTAFSRTNRLKCPSNLCTNVILGVGVYTELLPADVLTAELLFPKELKDKGKFRRKMDLNLCFQLHFIPLKISP